MPTSSIFAHVRITDPQKVDMFVDAMEASVQTKSVNQWQKGKLSNERIMLIELTQEEVKKFSI